VERNSQIAEEAYAGFTGTSKRERTLKCGLRKSMYVATCPSLHQRKEGRPSDKEMLRSHKREAGATNPAKGKPPRMREQMLREISTRILLALKSSQVIWTAVPLRRGIYLLAKSILALDSKRLPVHRFELARTPSCG